MNTYRIDLAWDGTRYCGWQRQPATVSIQETVENALRQIFPAEEISVTGAGRTDAGVHALHQVCAFRTAVSRDCAIILRGINSKLPPDIVCLAVMSVPNEFHPRYQSKSKHYRYRIWRSSVRSPFEHPYTWHLPTDLDIASMVRCVELFVGTHDFSAFRAAGCSATHTVRSIEHAQLKTVGQELHFDVVGKGFLRHMVRIMMGTLVAVGQQKMKIREVEEALRGGERVKVGMTAPAKGLWLVSTSLT